MLSRTLRVARIVLGSVLIATFAAACGGSGSNNGTPQTSPFQTFSQQSSLRHVFVIMLENKTYGETFSASSAAPYLATTLPAMGALIPNYYGTGHVSLDNYISFISGQSPTVQTDNDCTTGFNNITPATITQDGYAQTVGTGCVYPATVKTVADELVSAGFTWKAYMGDMGNDPTRESATCGHPAIGTIDGTQTAEAPTASVPAGDAYATRHDPFVYFQSILSSPSCATNVVNLNNVLPSDLQSISTTANLTFITPNLCDDGHDSPCAIDGQPGGLNRINTFLQKWVPLILSSPAYKQDGLLLITFDESDYGGESVVGGTLTISWPGATCCGEQEGPNLGAFPQTQALSAGSTTYNLVKTSFGGDQVGAVVLSKYITPGTVSNVAYNHYSALATIENIFNLPKLGYSTGATGFGTDVFTGP